MGRDKVKMWYDGEVDVLYVSFKEGENKQISCKIHR